MSLAVIFLFFRNNAVELLKRSTVRIPGGSPEREVIAVKLGGVIDTGM
jgi:hypothetical protein